LSSIKSDFDECENKICGPAGPLRAEKLEAIGEKFETRTPIVDTSLDRQALLRFVDWRQQAKTFPET
jgi:hypothetical protein